MSDTLGAIRLDGDDWQDVSTLTSIPTGTSIYIQSQSSSTIQVAISATKPAKSFKGVMLPNDARYPAMITAGENKVWLYGTGPVSIQEV